MLIKIFRLRSGEELISNILEENKRSYKVSNPMIFKSNMVSGPLGTPYDMTVLKDWLSNTSSKETLIPKNHIINSYDPSEETFKLYELQLQAHIEKQKIIKTDSMSTKSNTPFLPLNSSEEANLFEDFLGAILGDLSEKYDTSKAPTDNSEEDFLYDEENQKKKRKRSKRKNPDLSPEMDEDELERSGIYISMMIPGEIIMNLVTAGILSPKDLLKMIKETKKRNRFTGDEVDRKDFGNKYSDWNPDPSSDDYF